MDLEQDKKNLDYNGYTLIKNVLPKDECKLYVDLIDKYCNKEYAEKMRNGISKDWDGNWLFNLQNKDYKFYDLLRHEYIEELLKYKLNDRLYRNQVDDDPNYILQMFTARGSGKTLLDMHSDMRTKTCNYNSTLGVTVLWYLGDTNVHNGCTYLVPGSHLINLTDGEPYITDRSFKNTLPLEASAGDVLMFDQALWHGAHPNLGDDVSWRIQTAYNRWWIKPSFDIPNSVPNDFYKKLSNKEKSILGFCSQPSRNEFERVSMSSKYSELKDELDT
tara:strand:- start:70 stop:894 length:825 start_codon:yes stop_codon:yes gene_type:complete